MWIRQTVLCVALLAFALITQQAFLSRIGLPGSTPDLLLVTVIALALAYGPATGAVVGFGAGLALDFDPATAGIIGLSAGIYALVGFITGIAIEPRDRTPLALLGIASLSCGASVIAYGALNMVFGNERVIWGHVPPLVLTSALYGLLLALAVIPVVAWLVGKITPEVNL
ncbi:unannotated protein [freshwater metagenome]|uniref:Unannotated protein n=1 Tax=freshwater metagenome TaxID=449393 RepID=A0A6J7CTG8_9ZZZZ